MKKYYSISEVASVLGVPRRTLQSWEKAGKIPKPRRDPMSNYRLYTQEAIERLKKITGRPL